MSSVACPNCAMKFTSTGLLYKHQSKFCVGGPAINPRNYEEYYSHPYSSSSNNESSRPHFYTGPSYYGQGQNKYARPESVRSFDSNSSMSIHLPDDNEELKKRPHVYQTNNRLKDLQIEAAKHGKNLQGLHSKQAHLRQQRDEIERRLSRLGHGDSHLTPDPHLQRTESRIVQELQQQETRNNKQLDQLRRQLQGLQVGGTNTFGADVLPEIQAMRQAYLRQGGSNPGILARMADLEAEARAAADRPQKQSKNRNKNRVESLNEQMLAFELENQRLQNELLMMQERNNERIRNMRNKQSQEDMENFSSEVRARQKEHLQKLADLEHEMEVAKQEARLERMRREMEQLHQPPQVQPPPHPPMQPFPVQSAREPTQQPVTYTPSPEFVYESPVRPLPASYRATVEPAPQGQPAQVPYLMSGHQLSADDDPLSPAPYDQTSGFVIFYDLALGLEPSTKFVRLVTCLYNNEAQYGEPTMLPAVQTDTSGHHYYSLGSQVALISARQPVPRCPSIKDMSLVIELQTSAGGGASGYTTAAQGRLSTKAWTKLDLFDLHGRLISGRWRVPLRMTPINPALSTADLSSVPMYGAAELCVRFVNQRDADAQATSRVDANNAARYAPPPLASQITQSLPTPDKYSAQEFMPRTAPRTDSDRKRVPTRKKKSPRKRLEDYDYDGHSFTIGFQVDRVKGAEAGEGKVRLTAYHKRSGQIVQSETSPVTCTTTSVRTQFKHKYHVFGQQEATFRDVDIKGDIVLIVRFYVRKLLSGHNPATTTNSEEDDEKFLPDTQDNVTLVGWGSLPLVIDRHGDERVNVGTHVIALYEPPVPDADAIPLEEHWTPKQWRRYGDASARVHIFQGEPRPGSLTPSDLSDADEDTMPEGAWLPHERTQQPKKPFTASDGVDLYVDSARFLPDSVTITRVAGRVLTRKYESVGKNLNVNMEGDSDIYNPVFNYKIEYREPNMKPTSTIMFKVYTVDKFYKKSVVVGYAALNMFVVLGTDKQPRVDTGGVQLSVNEGCHQLRLYAEAPTNSEIISATSMKESNTRMVPCATLLVRLYQAPVSSNGRPMNMDRYPQYDWERLGIFTPLPFYSERVYYSMECKPTKSERLLYHTQVRRPAMSVKDAVRIIQGDSTADNLTTDKQVTARIKSILTKAMDQPHEDIDLTFIAAYQPKHGIKIALDSAMNLPWSNFTHATLCLNPPGAFYMGQAQASYDRLKFTRDLDLKSTTAGPQWKDNFFHFTNRAYHKYLTVIIHLQEVSVTKNRDTYKYGLLNQAWTAVQVFNEGYVRTEAMQLPLFHGPPKMHLLRALARDPTRQWIIDNVVNQQLKPVEHCSVFVRVADGRREGELPALSRQQQLNSLADGEISLNVDYIPPNQRQQYSREQPGTGMDAFIPPGKAQDNFVQELADKFKSLVHKQYEESAARQN